MKKLIFILFLFIATLSKGQATFSGVINGATSLRGFTFLGYPLVRDTMFHISHGGDTMNLYVRNGNINIVCLTCDSTYIYPPIMSSALGGGGGSSGATLTNGFGISGSSYDGSVNRTWLIDTGSTGLATAYDLTSGLVLKLNISDTASMLSKYLRAADTLYLSNRINLKLNISDTATMLGNYLHEGDTIAFTFNAPLIRSGNSITPDTSGRRAALVTNYGLQNTDSVGTLIKGVWNATSIDTTYTNAVSTIAAGSGVSIQTDGKKRTITATGSGGTVTSVATTAPVQGGTITGTGTISVDTSSSVPNHALVTRYSLNTTDTVGTIGSGTWQGSSIDTTYTSAASRVTVAAPVVRTIEGKTYKVTVDTSAADAGLATNYKIRTTDSVGTLVSGSIGLGFTAIDTARTNAASRVTAGSGISITTEGKTYKVSATGGTGTVTTVSTSAPVTGGPFTTSGTIAVDTSVADAALATNYKLRTTDSVGTLVSGSIGSGFTAIDTARTNAASQVTAGANITVTKEGKTYKVAGNAGTVTSVSGNAPVSSSGGATPAISVDTTAANAALATNYKVRTTDSVGTLVSGTWNATSIDTAYQNGISQVTVNAPVTRTIEGKTYKISVDTSTANANLATQYYVSTHSGSGTVTSVGSGYGLTGGPITTSGTLLADSTVLVTKADRSTISGAKTFTNGITTTGTATINIGADASAQTVNIANGVANKTLNVGSNDGASTTNFYGGTGGLAFTTPGSTDVTFNAGSTGTLKVVSTTSGSDQIAVKPQSTTTTNAFNGTVTSNDLTATRTWNMPDTSGSLMLQAFNGNRPITNPNSLTNQNYGGTRLWEWLEAMWFPSQNPLAEFVGTNGVMLEDTASGGTATTRTISFRFGRQASTNPLVSPGSISVTSGSPTPQNFSPSFTPPVAGAYTGTLTQNIVVNKNTDVQFQISVTTTDSKTASAQTTYYWRARRYWGLTTNATPTSSDVITALNGSFDYQNFKSNTVSVAGDGSTQRYFFYAYPQSANGTTYGQLTTIKINGGTFYDVAKEGTGENGMTRMSLSVTSALGFVTDYWVYYTNGSSGGNYTNVVAQ